MSEVSKIRHIFEGVRLIFLRKEYLVGKSRGSQIVVGMLGEIVLFRLCSSSYKIKSLLLNIEDSFVIWDTQKWLSWGRSEWPIERTWEQLKRARCCIVSAGVLRKQQAKEQYQTVAAAFGLEVELGCLGSASGSVVTQLSSEWLTGMGGCKSCITLITKVSVTASPNCLLHRLC